VASRLRYEQLVLFLASYANFSQLASRLVISPVIPAILLAFSTEKGAIGLVLTAMWAMNALSQYPSGVLADVYGERALILASLSLTGVGSLLLAVAPSFTLFAVFAMILGAGTGMYSAVGASLLTKLSENTGRALGIHSSGTAIAGLLAPITAGFVSVWFGWRVALLVGAIVAIPAAVLVARYMRSGVAGQRAGPERRGPWTTLRDGFDPATVLGLLSRPSVAYTTAIAVIGMFMVQSLGSFLPTFLQEYRGFSTAGSGIAFGVIFLFSAVGNPILGDLSDRIARDYVIAAALGSGVAGLVVLITVSGPAGTIFGVVLLGGGMSWAGVIQSRFMDLFSDAERGASFGLVRTTYILLGSLGNVVTGMVAEIAGWPAAFGVIASLIVVAVLAAITNRAFGLGL